MITYLPCTAVIDSRYEGRLKQQVAETPFYRLERYDYYQLVPNSFQRNGASVYTEGKMSLMTGMSTEHTTSMSHTVSASVTTEASGKFLGIGASVALTVSYAFAYETSDTTSTSKETTFEYPIPRPPKGRSEEHTSELQSQ